MRFLSRVHNNILNRIEPFDPDELRGGVTIIQLTTTVGIIIWLCLKIL